MRFLNKTVVVTGGAQGIGRETCIKFAEEGAIVFIVDIMYKHGEELESFIQKKGQKAFYIHADITKESDVVNFCDNIKEKTKKIDVLVNCAMKGIIKGLDATVEEWTDCFMTNVVGFALCIKHCSEMMKGIDASIINIASISGFIAQPNYLTYNTTKGALVNMVRCLAMDLADFGIRVNNVCPGTIWTEKNAYFIKKDYGVDLEQANVHPELGGKHLLHRVGFPVEVANCILFLASNEASFVTGTNLIVDGGYTAKA